MNRNDRHIENIGGDKFPRGWKPIKRKREKVVFEGRTYEHDEGVHNPDVCIACVASRIKAADDRHETPDWHDVALLKSHYGGNW